MGQPQRSHVELDDYLAIEKQDDVRYEYYDGVLYAMAGGTINHTLICGNAYSALRGAAKRGGTCVPFTSEMKVEVKLDGQYVYPDAGLACPKIVESERLTGAVVNPCVIVEVTSEDSGDYDRGGKMTHYFSVPSVQEYVLISQEKFEVFVFRRRNDLMRIDNYVDPNAVIPIECTHETIRLSELYENVEFIKAAKK
ncbi:Uma2 family endonuclease [Neolewinella antarctica]|uniref:Uma2 family endonuclease n=1 Tax=Neolewinella antarctica TaxID=442734 RepID=A0ABX0XBV0_9BACT|nr:Uma2 family endonuclease [Neolewinella antarctica]NJC26724.1 Uma2 family endonuclease [Neolewinella antarctica]